MTMLRITTLVALASLSFGMTACKRGPVVEELTEEQRQNPRELFLQGVRFLTTPGADGTPQYEKAYAEFSRSATLESNPKVHFNAAWTAEQLGDLASAENHYRKAYEGDAGYTKAMYSLARVLTEVGKNEEVVALYQAALEKSPDNNALRNDLVTALAKAGNFDAAQAEAQEILRRDPENAAVYRALSSMYFGQSQLALSQLANEKALAITDADPGIYNNMGVTYVLQKDNARAIERFKTAIKLAPQHFEANMNLGFIALNSGDYQLADKCFTAANAANAQSEDAKLGLAVAKRGLKDFESADRLYREIIKASPQANRAYFNGSTLHEKYTKEFKKAERYLDDFIAANQGKIGPDHEVYSRKERIQQSIAEEKARQEELERQRREEEERRKRNEQLLAELKAEVAKTEAAIAQCSDDMIKEMTMMYVEQVKAAMAEEGAAEMAGDLKSFIDQANVELEGCSAGGTPEAGGGEAPPAEEAPQ